MQCISPTTVGQYRAKCSTQPDFRGRLHTETVSHSTPTSWSLQWWRDCTLLLNITRQRFGQNTNSTHLLYVPCYIPKMYLCELFFTPIHRTPQKPCFCIPCHNKGCDPWQTPCGAGVETQGSSPLLHWSLPYCPCPHACPAPSPLPSSWSRQESLSAKG